MASSRADALLALAFVSFSGVVVAQKAPRLEIVRSVDGCGTDVDMRAERDAVASWLDRQGRRLALFTDPRMLATHDSENVRWLAMILVPGALPSTWFGTTHLRVTAPADLGGLARSVIELHAAARDGTSFTERDLAPDSVALGFDEELGRPVLFAKVATASGKSPPSANYHGSFYWLFDGEVIARPHCRAAGRPGAPVVLACGLDRAREIATLLRGDDEVPPLADTPIAAHDRDFYRSAAVRLAATRRLAAAGKPVLTFEQLAGWRYRDGLDGAPQRVRDLDGQHVEVIGYMMPIDEVDGARQFLLLDHLWDCAHGMAPTVNEMIRIELAEGLAAISISMQPVHVSGRLTVSENREDGLCLDVFQVVAEQVRPLSAR